MPTGKLPAPSRLGPDGRCPRTPAAALNSRLLHSSGGGGSGGGGCRTIQHGSGGGRDHGTQDAGERAGNAARPDTPALVRAGGVAARGPAPFREPRGPGTAQWAWGPVVGYSPRGRFARARTQTEAGLQSQARRRTGLLPVAVHTFASGPRGRCLSGMGLSGLLSGLGRKVGRRGFGQSPGPRDARTQCRLPPGRGGTYLCWDLERHLHRCPKTSTTRLADLVG